MDCKQASLLKTIFAFSAKKDFLGKNYLLVFCQVFESSALSRIIQDLTNPSFPIKQVNWKLIQKLFIFSESISLNKTFLAEEFFVKSLNEGDD